MKPEHTKSQRAGLFAIARLLDRVTKKKLNMKWFVSDRNGYDAAEQHVTPKECGYAGCAIGWGLTLPRYKRFIGDPRALASHLGLLGQWGFTPEAKAVFGGHRTGVTPKQVANDIRAYLKDGTLPKA